LDIVKKSTITPGRQSGVCSGERTPLMPASQPQAIMDVAKPLAAWAAVIAQRSLVAVTINRLAHISKASAKVFSISMLLICTYSSSALPGQVFNMGRALLTSVHPETPLLRERQCLTPPSLRGAGGILV